MVPEVPKPLPAFGFLTAVEDALHGFFGGYLVISERGLPLEFHCSTPVQPSEAQRILYGASLRPYLLGELIGQTLVAKAQLPVQAVVTDLAEMQNLAAPSVAPVAWLRQYEINVLDTTIELEPRPLSLETSLALETAPSPTELILGNYRLSTSTQETWQADVLREALSSLAAQIDLAEPFERIREAIREAQRVTDHGSECEDGPSSVAA